MYTNKKDLLPKNLKTAQKTEQTTDLFRLCPPPPVRYAPPSDRARVITW